MNFHLLIIFLICVYIPSIYAENSESFEVSKFSDEDSNITSKLHPILIQWQAAEDPNEFAKNKNLSYKEDKIKVYIYLESAELRSKLPPEITISSFDEKIVVAFVSSEQLDKLDNLDFVERVMLPVLARTPPIPQIETPETEIPEENGDNYLILITIGGIAIFTISVIIKKYRTFKN